MVLSLFSTIRYPPWGITMFSEIVLVCFLTTLSGGSATQFTNQPCLADVLSIVVIHLWAGLPLCCSSSQLGHGCASILESPPLSLPGLLPAQAYHQTSFLLLLKPLPISSGQNTICSSRCKNGLET